MNEYTLLVEMGVELPEHVDKSLLYDLVLQGLIRAVTTLGGVCGGTVIVLDEVDDE